MYFFLCSYFLANDFIFLIKSVVFIGCWFLVVLLCLEIVYLMISILLIFRGYVVNGKCVINLLVNKSCIIKKILDQPINLVSTSHKRLLIPIIRK